MLPHEVTERADPDGARRLGVAGLVGRDQELALLISVLTSSPALVMVEGEAGVGKTRLVQEYLARDARRRRRALVMACPPFRQPQTLGPVTDALRQALGDIRELQLTGLAGALRPLFPEWADRLPAAPDAAGDASMARHRLFLALEELLGCAGVELLVAEDVHWADEATVEFLLFLASRGGNGFQLVLTCRPEYVAVGALLRRLTSRLATGTGGFRITLGPLDVTAIGALVSSMLTAEQVTHEFAAFLHQRTEGLPLAVEELVRLMISRHELIHSDGGWRRQGLAAIQVPPTIRDAVLERASGLSADAGAVLQAVAVVGEPADEVTIRAVARISAARARAGLSTALVCGLLGETSGGLAGFRHALASQAVYESIPGPDRRVLHQRAGQVLERACPPSAARLARHFKQAGETAKWRRYGEQAADTALATGDEAAAALLLADLVVNSGAPAAAAARLTGKLPFSALAGVGFDELIDALSALLATDSLEPGDEAYVRFQLGHALTHVQRWPEGRAELQRAIPGLGHDRITQARAMMLLAWPRGDTCPAGEHVRWLRRAAALPPPAEPAERLRLAVDRASALLMLGEEDGWAGAAAIPLEAPTAHDWPEIARGNHNFGDQALRWGRYREAASRLEKALELARSHQYRQLHDDALAMGMLLDWLTGAWDGLRARAVALAQSDDLIFMTRLETALVIGQLDAVGGERRRADERLRLLLAEIAGLAEAECAMEPAAALARLRLADGFTAGALEVTDKPISIIVGKGIWVWAADLAPARVAALAAADRVSDAAALVDAFGRGLGDRDAPAPQAGLVLCRAILAQATSEHTRAAALYDEAAAAWQALPRPYDALLARERQALCLIADGQASPGVALLSEVLPLLTRLGAIADADRVAAVLRGHGINARRVWHGGRHGYGQDLSPREREVVGLVLTGLTNPQIAQRLSRSPKTVAAQLNSAMRKFGVRSRTALAVKAVEAGVSGRAMPAPAAGSGPAGWRGREDRATDQG
jgi:DNA-binding CsgD family transcriptional regulator